MPDRNTKSTHTTKITPAEMAAAANARRLAEKLYDAVIEKGGDHQTAGMAARRLEASLLAASSQLGTV